MLDPKRTVAELRELQELTGDENGAQRVAWTDTWVAAQDWMAAKLDGIEMEFDEARNQWWTVPGETEASSPPCPFCGSSAVRLESPFGPTRCRAIYYCSSCKSSFEHMKNVSGQFTTRTP